MNSKSEEQLLDQILLLIESIITSGPFAISRDWFSLQLRIAHVKILFLLLIEGPKRMTELSRSLDISLSGSTSLIDRLVEQNLVDRKVDPNNRRSVICILTKEGNLLTTRLLRERRSKWEYRLKNLNKQELILVNQAMELIFNSYDTKGNDINRKRETVLEGTTSN